MKIRKLFGWRKVVGMGLVALSTSNALAQSSEPLVPGTGTKAVQVGDDFEDESWEWFPNWPKSTKNINKFEGGQGGISRNQRWYEGVKRGQPDIVKRVKTPEDGLPNSKGSLLLHSLHTGVPGRPSYQLQQDDFICDVEYRLGGTIPIWQCPNFVVRVFLPPVAKWERRSGAHFAIRSAVDVRGWTDNDGELDHKIWGREIYYPGMFVEFETKEDFHRPHDCAALRIRAQQSGHDYKGLEIKQTGWWTFGMSFTRDGAVHYYAKPGVEDLTNEDRIASHFPYGHRAERFKTFFFNVCNGDNGRTWSSDWIIDDPTLYWLTNDDHKELVAKSRTKSRSSKSTSESEPEPRVSERKKSSKETIQIRRE